MFPPRGPRRGCPRQPGPWWDGPRLRPPAGPGDTWGEPPWQEPPLGEPPWHDPAWQEPPQEDQRRKRQRRRHEPSPRDPRPFPGPAEAPWKEEEEGWAPQDCPPQPPWDDREHFQGAENGFGDTWQPPPRPFPGPADVLWQEEQQDGRWDCPPQPPWDDREDFQGFEDGFGWSCLAPGVSSPGRSRPHPGPPPALHVPRFISDLSILRYTNTSVVSTNLFSVTTLPHSPPSPGLCSRRNPGFPRGPRPPWRRRSHPRQLTPVPLLWCPRPPRAHKPHSKPCPAPSKRSQELQPPQPPAAESPEQPQVELEAGQTPVGSQEQGPCALGADPAPLEETPRCPEVEPCSPAVPKAGTAHGPHPQSPAAPPDPARREIQEPSPSGEAGAELSPRSWEQPPRGAGEAEAEAAQHRPLQSLQPPRNPQVPPGCAAEPQAQPSQAPAGACSPPETSQPGSGETNPALLQLCPLLPTPFPAGIDPRSAAVLAKKAEIELSYQQFSLTVAVVATMLLQKEPSLEAALGLALRANLRQRRLHHLQQLQDFIDTFDSATASL
ncbi:basic proline-rich protein-like isoform X2 [Oenanthe melanoleuca]|uniref:basic proline-rich protein-like isoform X2 n=1 Tax=Oenanthe melanoleuca TaxID=2939378 RepID=UPI0024C1F76E|nr:basic proline-rich protein-like isoform X2 [Oenanthe melanoleuca]